MVYTALALLLSAINYYFYFRLENNMAVTREEFDAALQAGVTTIISKIDDLAAKVAAGAITTPEDFSAELAILQTAVSEALSKDPDPAPAATE
jgi:hypothetical protein